MRHSVRATAAVLAIGLGLVGCANSKGKPAAKPDTSVAAAPVAAADVIKAATAKLDTVKSAKYTMTMKLTMPGEGAGTMTGSGVATFTPPVRGRFKSVINAAGQSFDTEMIMTTDAMYMRLPSLQGTAKPWVKVVFSELSDAIAGVDIKAMMNQSQQNSPTGYVKMLSAASDMRVVGKETIRGEETTHYSGTIRPADLAKFYTGAAKSQGETMAQLIGNTPIELDTFIGADGLPRRVHQVMTIGGNDADVTIDLSDYGVRVDIQPPPASETTDLATMMGRG